MQGSRLRCTTYTTYKVHYSALPSTPLLFCPRPLAIKLQHKLPLTTAQARPDSARLPVAGTLPELLTLLVLACLIQPTVVLLLFFLHLATSASHTVPHMCMIRSKITKNSSISCHQNLMAALAAHYDTTHIKPSTLASCHRHLARPCC